jgi:hypothetical protein
MEEQDGWLTVLEKNGLGPAAGILENYGIDSEADLLVLDQDDFSKLASRGLKPLYAKKLERWCGAARDAPAASALLSSESLNVVTPAAHSVGAEESECESGAENESESDGEDDDDSDDDLEIVGEESGTADSTGASSAGTETPAKKAKITLTAEQQKFAEQFHPAASKIDNRSKYPHDTSQAGVPPSKSKEQDGMM